jgi:hypothetical protein
MMQLIITQLQLRQNNLFSILCNSIIIMHDVMMMSLIVIHLLKPDMWHYEDFWIEFFFKILISIIHMIINDGSRL